MISKIFKKLKELYDAHKIIMFIASLIVGTNAMQAGVQEYVRSDPTYEKQVKAVSSNSKPQKTIIIRKVDNEYCDRKLDEHKTGSQH